VTIEVVVSGSVVVSITQSTVVEENSSIVVVDASLLVVTSLVVVSLTQSRVEVRFPSGEGPSSMHKHMNKHTETKKTKNTLAITKYQV
jgi:hypothetical protein